MSTLIDRETSWAIKVAISLMVVSSLPVILISLEATVERVGREVLDEVAFGLSDGLEGTAQIPGHAEGTGWPWSATITDMSREDVGPRLLEITLTLEHPGSDIENTEEFVISTRILVAEDDPLAANAVIGSQLDSGSGF